MRKGYLILLSVIALIGGCLAFSACGEHDHYSEKGYTASASEHYKICDKCGEKFDVEEHTADAWQSDEDGHYKVCTVCNAEFADGEHELGSWTSDANSHWQVCSVCSSKVNLSAHHLGDWETDSANKFHFKTCSDCLVRIDEKEHTAKTWETDGVNHYQICLKCNLKFNEAEHAYEWQTNMDSHWRFCTVCEEVADEGPHNKTNDWQSDGVSHWKSCTVCEQRLDEKNHEADSWSQDSSRHSQVCKICDKVYNEGEHTAVLYRADEDKHWKICESCGFRFDEGNHNSSLLCTICDQDFVGTEDLLFTPIKDIAGNTTAYTVGLGDVPVASTEISIPLQHDHVPVTFVGMTYDEWYELYKTGTHDEAEISEYTSKHCFLKMENLTKVRLPATLTDVGIYAFSGSMMKEIDIPDNVSTINAFAFMGCTSLERIHFPTELKAIEDYAFQYTPNFKMEINLPEKVEKIGEGAFQTSAITSLKVGKNVTEIGLHSFYECRYLKDVTLADSVTQIGIEAFRECFALESVKLSAELAIIESRAFIYCENLTTISIPKSVTNINDLAFNGCSKLKNIIFEDPTNWSAGADAISEKDLAKPAVAAKYLTLTYSKEGLAWSKE